MIAAERATRQKDPTVALDMKGMRVTVACGSRGIGWSIALVFAANGASVSICARRAETLESAREELVRATAMADAATRDLAQPGAVRRYMDEAAAALNELNVLVNNATGEGGTVDVLRVLRQNPPDARRQVFVGQTSLLPHVDVCAVSLTR